MAFRTFTPFRALGYVAGDAAAAVTVRGGAFFVTSAVGDAFHVYDGARLGLLLASPRAPRRIAAVAVGGDVTFAACGGRVLRYRRARADGEVDAGAPVTALLLLGGVLLALAGDRLLAWDAAQLAPLLDHAWDPADFRPTCLAHPPTYVNKVVVGSAQGALELFNFAKAATVHRFAPPHAAPVACIAASPVVDVVAVGFADGTVALHNLRYDEPVAQLRQEGRVTAVAFRTDGPPLMATGGPAGDVTLWDLEKRRVAHVARGAHDGPVATCVFVPGQPLLVTSSPDNSLKEWVFDGADPAEPRLLRHRAGHSAPPTRIRFYGPEGHSILSAGRDRSVRLVSVIRDARSAELSQGSVAKKAAALHVRPSDLKLPPAVEIDASETRESDWANVLTAHAHDVGVRTWETRRLALGKHLLRTPDGAWATAVCVSACGHFGLVGSEAGAVAMHSMQSGLRRYALEKAHAGRVTGIATDAANRIAVTAGADRRVRFWDFATGRPLHSLELPASATSLAMHRPSGLVAAACDDFSVRVIDSETRRVVREFRGHRNRLTDVCFSPDARTVVSASMDGTIRCWDVPTGFLVDLCAPSAVCTSLSFSPRGDFLATAHADSVGIFLWANKAQFAAVQVRRIGPEEEAALLEAGTQGLPAAAEPEEGSEDGVEESALAVPVEEAAARAVVEDGTVTLSDLPRQRWQSLLNLESIKKRNKPKQPPKAPEQAPFFLPTLPGVQPKFVRAEADGGSAEPERSSRVLSMGELHPRTEFARLLHAGLEDEAEFAAWLSHAKSLSPTALDFEIRNLGPSGGLADFRGLLRAIRWSLDAGRDFEVPETLLNLFLKVHGDELVANFAELREDMEAAKESHERTWGRVREGLNYARCLVGFAQRMQ
ncbi:Utp21 specific WD40 associated putative domain-containing protein [Hyaloraphidium curvatum]|nr:Utp21 specific WD40 associated putative domain-containing protein [Hyaloraphidium curvatum]